MKLIAALGVVAAAPGVSAALRNNSNYECVGSTLGPGQSLGPNQFICDPSNDSNRFGMTFMGMPALYNMDGKMVWWAATRGTNLTLNPTSSILELLGEGVDKWNSGCIGAKKPNRVALEDGGVKVYDKNGAIIGEATDTISRPNGSPSSYGSVYLTNYKWFSGYVEKLEK